jgi:hypothetical protein
MISLSAALTIIFAMKYGRIVETIRLIEASMIGFMITGTLDIVLAYMVFG